MDYPTYLFLLEEPCYQALGRFNGPHNVSGAHTKNGKNRSWKAANLKSTKAFGLMPFVLHS